MICNICGQNQWIFQRRYNEPDKYEAWVGIAAPICRTWWKCANCGFYRTRRTYDLKQLETIYSDGYRAEGFRGVTIEEVFAKIVQLPFEKSENKYRIRWFLDRIGTSVTGNVQALSLADTKSILDIGAGLGVFLWELLAHQQDLWEPHAVEINAHSVRFLTSLGIACYHSLEDSPHLRDVDVVACIHTLEHMEDPESFLLDTRDALKDGGKLFIEVPDAKEFSYLPPDHDEFNSCHITFFTPETLMWLVNGTGYKVTDLHMVRTNERNLSRIMLLAEKK